LLECSLIDGSIKDMQQAKPNEFVLLDILKPSAENLTLIVSGTVLVLEKHLNIKDNLSLIFLTYQPK
jgi:hypothetical protein